MDKIKSYFKNLSLRKSFVLYVASFTLVALLLSGITASLCNRGVANIYSNYPLDGERYYLTTDSGELLGDGVMIGDSEGALSPKDARLISVLRFLPIVLIPLYSALCLLTAATLFYRIKLKRPLLELMSASTKIAGNDLDFTIDYESKDELGQLCSSFEVMRSTLTSNLSEMWRQIEDRKRLNAAFAHDLRTPLTVLKGYGELLQNSQDQTTQETAATMEKHINRMERYIDSMSGLHRLEDMQPDFQEVSLNALFDAMRDSADICCKTTGKGFTFIDNCISPVLVLDRSCILRVCSNLIENAARYATTKVTLIVKEQDKGLLLEVADDGPGFSKSGLCNASSPYYTEDKRDGDHYGLGLYICRVLCEHHGGYLKFENAQVGAKVTAYFESR